MQTGLKSLGKEWEIEEDSFIDDTPMGPKHFTNVIATFNPRKFKNRLVFAAHIDSKYFPEPNRCVRVGLLFVSLQDTFLINIFRSDTSASLLRTIVRFHAPSCLTWRDPSKSSTKVELG